MKQKLVNEAQKVGLVLSEYIEHLLNNRSDNKPFPFDNIKDYSGVLNEIKQVANKSITQNHEILKKLESNKEDNHKLSDLSDFIDEETKQRLDDLVE